MKAQGLAPPLKTIQIGSRNCEVAELTEQQVREHWSDLAIIFGSLGKASEPPGMLDTCSRLTLALIQKNYPDIALRDVRGALSENLLRLVSKEWERQLYTGPPHWRAQLGRA
jgi:hypothetical protein